MRGEVGDEVEEEPPQAGWKFGPMKRFAGCDKLGKKCRLIPLDARTVDETVAAMRSRDQREGKVKPDSKLIAEMGWVLPDGKFYACLTKMEHIWLASQFGLTETQAEQAGWVKITEDFVGARFIHQGKIPATQKQINTVFDWCEKHKAKLPEWAGGSDQS